MQWTFPKIPKLYIYQRESKVQVSTQEMLSLHRICYIVNVYIESGNRWSTWDQKNYADTMSFYIALLQRT